MQSSQPRVEVLLEEVVKKKASDLHLQVGLPPIIRVDGVLVPVAGADSGQVGVKQRNGDADRQVGDVDSPEPGVGKVRRALRSTDGRMINDEARKHEKEVDAKVAKLEPALAR